MAHNVPAGQPPSPGANATQAPSRVERSDAARECDWLTALVDSIDDAVIAKDTEGKIVTWNAAAARLYGYRADEAVGHPISMLVPPEAWDEYEQITERLGRGERISNLETVRRRKDGSRVQVSLTISPLRNSQGKVTGAGVTVRDLSAIKRSESEVLKGRARLRAILDTAVDAIIMIDGRGLIQTINPATERMFGYSLAELVGQNVKILMPSPYHEEHDGYLARYKQTGEKRIIGVGREVSACAKDGTVFPIDVSVSEVVPGKLFTGIIRDLSERKIMEAKLRQADRIATIGTVAAGLGHDINNLLFVLRTNTDVLGADSLSPEGVTALQSLRSVIAYLQNLSRGMRLIALDPENRGEGTTRTTCLADWAPVTTALLKTANRPGVAIELKVPSNLPDVDMASHHLTQVVFNLVGNAVNAIGDAPTASGGLVRVTAGLAPDGKRVLLEVVDNGSGMPPEVLKRAFEPLFTTRASHGGTGLGLALVKRLVMEAGGEVEIKSTPGSGTTVTVYLCAARAVEVPEAPARKICAVVSIADPRAAAVVRHVLENLGAAIRGTDAVDEARLWIVDPASAELSDVKQWVAQDPQQRHLVLLGKPPPDPAPEWELLRPAIIDDPSNFEDLRSTIARALNDG